MSLADADPHDAEKRVFRVVLFINLAQALLGLGVGFFARSTAVVSIGLDNLADAAVYALALIAVARSRHAKANVARFSGGCLIVLATLMLLETARRFVYGVEPYGVAMIAMAAVNAVSGVFCVRLLAKHQRRGALVKAVKIFSANDVAINLGTAVAGALVLALGSPWPDLVIGVAVALIAARGGKEILETARSDDRHDSRASDNETREAQPGRLPSITIGGDT
jgi:Co/Zn/Cd efflux system component